MKFLLTLSLAVVMVTSCANAQDIKLPEPQKNGGKPLMEALSVRQSAREFDSKELDNQTLSNLLWAAYGFNRDDKRTAPSANNKQEFSIYVALKSGMYLYDAKNNNLKLVVKKDLRKNTGSQPFVGTAPLNLVYAYNKEVTTAPKYAYIDCGYISQNVYLFCASAGLASVARGYVPAEELAKELKLANNMEIVLAQTVGYPKK